MAIKLEILTRLLQNLEDLEYLQCFSSTAHFKLKLITEILIVGL